jgi:hypothetical protein
MSKLSLSSVKLSVLALAAMGVLVSGAKAAPAPTVVGQTVTAVAVVESVDQHTRQVLLTGPDGSLSTVIAGPGVRNLAQVHAGDHLVLTYQEAVAVQLSPSDAALPPPTVKAAAIRAARGQLPAGATYSLLNVHVKIDAVDQKTGTVNYTRSDGTTGSLVVKTPAMLDFAKGLKPGDQVEMNYLQALTIRDIGAATS